MTDSRFPVPSAPCPACLSRRSFVVHCTLVAAGALSAGCSDNPIAGPVEPKQIRVSDFPGLATRNLIVMVDDLRAVKRTGVDTFAAFSRICPHAGAIVDLDSNAFLCIRGHGSRFDNDGQLTLGPATRNLDSLAASYDPAADTLLIQRP